MKLMKLTEEQRKIIDKFPDDGTDWDGIHDEVMLKILDDYKIIDEISEIFIRWNEHLGTTDQIFSETMVTILGSKYLEKAREIQNDLA